ncbi:MULTISPECIES: anti-sigma factor antagonist [Metabacillus]|jgi:anti-sigma B factor antagonist|uniref:Anti-sigma factor antagonist n=3 Tax=Metabacillus TaxID=2675233 RepID=A0A179T0U9_9BACI|nr:MULTISPECIES: anti-sigma factor antagonist [Metabacillus]OAS86182.1 anti-anti sigma factor [Metabacillus litoralis]QNF27903.1 anti-sigma factor antagonist [Metabacillus sp. KUDC1714]
MNIKVDIDKLDDKTVVFVAGEIDAFTAPKLREALLPLAEEFKSKLIVNLKNVSYMDSTGLGVFVGLLKIIRKNDGHLNLVELSDRLERLFSITGLNDIIDISSKSEGGVQ